MKKTEKLYDEENIARKQVEFAGRKLPEVKTGEIWWYYVGVNIGQEISRIDPYMRPCIILDICSGSSLVHIIPLSSNLPKLCRDRYIPFHQHHKFGLKKSYFVTHQCATIDKKRLIKFQSHLRVSAKMLYLLKKRKI